MPASSRNRKQSSTSTTETGEDRSSVAGSGKTGKAKRKSKPTTSRRAKRQKVKETYSKSREEAQLIGLIPTTPEGAIHPEVVSSSVQTDQPLPQLTSEAIRKGWAVPEERKPRLVDELIGIVDNLELPAKVRVAAFNALRQADDSQHERENPSGKKGSGATVNINGNVVQNNIEANKSAAEAIRDMVMNGQLGVLEGVRASVIASTPSIDGHIREVEDGSTPPGHQ